MHSPNQGLPTLKERASSLYKSFLEANTVQLSYRGVKYSTSQSAVEVTETQEIGHYRGATYHVRRALSVPARRSGDVLKYRGAVVH